MTANTEAKTLHLPILRLHFAARADSSLTLPPYAGSMLRGAFGHALKALAPLPHGDDGTCALGERCAFCTLFLMPERPAHSLQKFSQMPHPYVIEPPAGGEQLQPGDTFRFSMVLVGRATGHVPAITLAWARALGTGLAMHRERATCTLLAAQAEGSSSPYWHAGAFTNRATSSSIPATLLPEAPRLGPQATLQLMTPLRLQQGGKPARASNLRARALLIALARRWQLLADIHLGADAPQQDFPALVAAAETISIGASKLRWFDWGRYSQHQRREMRLGGLLGSVRLQGDLAPFRELLHIGQWLHVGKNATFGLGGYRLHLG